MKRSSVTLRSLQRRTEDDRGVEGVRGSRSPMRTAIRAILEFWDRLIDGLRKAGMPEE